MTTIRRARPALGPTTTRQPADWRQQAACLDEDAELFFPVQQNKAGIAEAMKICADCPVMMQCRRYALEQREQFGVWGGFTEDERRAIWRKNARVSELPSCGTERGWASHQNRRETPCGDCKAAHERHLEADRRERLEAEHAKGGTNAGLQIHIRLGEKPCELCLAANRVKCAEYRARRRKGGRPAVTQLRPANLEKYADILRRKNAGASTSALALEYDLSTSRIRKIVRDMRALEVAA